MTQINFVQLVDANWKQSAASPSPCMYAVSRWPICHRPLCWTKLWLLDLDVDVHSQPEAFGYPGGQGAKKETANLPGESKGTGGDGLTGSARLCGAG